MKTDCIGAPPTALRGSPWPKLSDTWMRMQRRSLFPLNSDTLLFYVAARRKVTRAEASRDHPLYTRDQITYGLDKLHKQRKVRRHPGPGGAFVYTFRHL